MAPLGCVSCGLTSLSSLIIRNVSVKKPGADASKESATPTVINETENPEATPRASGADLGTDNTKAL